VKKIISYNVNGIRAALKKDWLNWLQTVDPDIVCLQETKVQPQQLDLSLFEAIGYHTYWHSAEKKGYSSVALFSKTKPKHVEYGCGIAKYDEEGRILRADFDSFSILSCYFPSGTTGDERQDFKMTFLADFYQYINQLKEQIPHLIVSGDINICHTEIDIHNPIRNKNTSGFKPEERAWISQLLNSGWVDTFRHLNKNPHQYTWWTYRAGARSKNLGWRIDYHFITESLLNKLKRSVILADVVHSDHCPILLEIDL
jgi:exodeoxyribonuclease-3